MTTQSGSTPGKGRGGRGGKQRMDGGYQRNGGMSRGRMNNNNNNHKQNDDLYNNPAIPPNMGNQGMQSFPPPQHNPNTPPPQNFSPQPQQPPPPQQQQQQPPQQSMPPQQMIGGMPQQNMGFPPQMPNPGPMGQPNYSNKNFAPMHGGYQPQPYYDYYSPYVPQQMYDNSYYYQQQQHAPQPQARPAPKKVFKPIQIIDPETSQQVVYEKDNNKKKKEEEERIKVEQAKKAEEERLKQEEEEKERLRKEEEEKEKLRLEKEAEEERIRKEAEEKERLEKEAEEERLRQEAAAAAEAEKERLRLEEEERVRKEAEEERLRLEEEERLRKEEEEKERLRLEEEEKEKERLRLEEEEKERLRIEEENREKERIKQEEEEKERLRKEEEEKEKERLRKEEEEKERLRKEEEEKRRKEEQRKRNDPLFGDAVGYAVPKTRTPELPLFGQRGGNSNNNNNNNNKMMNPNSNSNMMNGPNNNNPNNNRPLLQQQPLQQAPSQQQPILPSPQNIVKPEYPEGFYSPSHPDGKREYTFDFMNAFRNIILSKPKTMAYFKEVDPVYRRDVAMNQAPNKRPDMNRQNSRGGQNKNSRNQRSNNNHHNNNNNHHNNNNNNNNRRNFSQNSRRNQQQQHQNQPQYVPTEDSWTPSTRKADVNISGLSETEKAELEDAKVMKQLLIILNKLTIEKFDKLFKEILGLDINQESRLSGMINMIFDKALEEPPYCGMYAELCLQFENRPGQVKNDKPSRFKWLLLQKCQQEFEKENDGVYEMTKGVAAEDEDETLVRAKLRMIGNIRFVGELFKRKILAERIMFSCLKKLLESKEGKKPSYESIECLHQLMFTVGKMLDHKAAEKLMNGHFEKIRQISEDKKIPIRYRFLMQDVLDLRASRWVPRKQEAGPKKIEDVSKDLAKAKEEKANQASRQQSQGSRRGGQQPQGRPQNNNDWNLVGAASVAPLKRAPSDAKKKLAPGGGMWGSQQAQAKPISKPGNAFELLEEQSNRSKQQGGRPKPAAAPAVARPKMDGVTIKKNVGAIFAEYCEIQDLEEVVFCIKELDSIANHHYIVEKLVTVTMAKKSRAPAITLIKHLMKEKLVTAEQFYLGFNAAVKEADDEELVVDVPRIYINLAEFVSALLLEESISLKQFLQTIPIPVFSEDEEDSQIGQVLALGLKAVADSKPDLAKKNLSESNVDWSKYINTERTTVEAFLTKMDIAALA